MERTCLFVSDLHGRTSRYVKLFAAIEEMKPSCVFIGGDLLPGALAEPNAADFLTGLVAPGLKRLRERLGSSYPGVFVILGNDDGKSPEADVLQLQSEGYWKYVHNRKSSLGEFSVYGYAYVPPTPFHLKDWERYDLSRYVDPGCIAPEDGRHTIPIPEQELLWSTIHDDLETLVGDDDLTHSVILFHAPPYRTNLDRGALDGKMIEHVPLDVHLGSIAIQRFIEARQPLVTLHGHVHESSRLTGSWRDKIGRTHCLNAAHDGSELSVILFTLEHPENARRELI